MSMKVKVSQRTILRLVNRTEHLTLQPGFANSIIYYCDPGSILGRFPILYYNSTTELLSFEHMLPGDLSKLATEFMQIAVEVDETWKDTQEFKKDLNDYLARQKEKRDKKRENGPVPLPPRGRWGKRRKK